VLIRYIMFRRNSHSLYLNITKMYSFQILEIEKYRYFVKEIPGFTNYTNRLLEDPSVESRSRKFTTPVFSGVVVFLLALIKWKVEIYPLATTFLCIKESSMETLSLCLNSLEYMMSPRKMSMVTFISYQPQSQIVNHFY